VDIGKAEPDIQRAMIEPSGSPALMRPLRYLLFAVLMLLAASRSASGLGL
jgi:hypothetical protein